MLKIENADESSPIVVGLRAVDSVIKKEVLERRLTVIEALESLLNYAIMLTAEIAVEDGWEEDELMDKVSQLRELLAKGVINEVRIRRGKKREEVNREEGQ